MKTIQIAVAASLGLALARPVLAVDGTQTTAQEREQVRAQVHRQLTTEGGVSEQDAKDLDHEVSANAAHPGYGEQIRQRIQDDLAAGCKGTCLASDLHAINGAVAKGVPPAQAVKGAPGASHAPNAPSDPQARSADHRQDAMHRDAAADGARDRSIDHGGHGQSGTHGMGSGHR